MSSERFYILTGHFTVKCPTRIQNVQRRTACLPNKISGEAQINFVYSVTISLYSSRNMPQHLHPLPSAPSSDTVFTNRQPSTGYAIYPPDKPCGNNSNQLVVRTPVVKNAHIDVNPGVRDWSTGLCGCMKDVRVCKYTIVAWNERLEYYTQLQKKVYTFRFVEYSEGSGPETNLGGAQYSLYMSHDYD